VRNLISGREGESTGFATGLEGAPGRASAADEACVGGDSTPPARAWLTCSLTGWLKVKSKSRQRRRRADAGTEERHWRLGKQKRA